MCRCVQSLSRRADIPAQGCRGLCGRDMCRLCMRLANGGAVLLFVFRRVDNRARRTRRALLRRVYRTARIRILRRVFGQGRRQYRCVWRRFAHTLICPRTVRRTQHKRAFARRHYQNARVLRCGNRGTILRCLRGLVRCLRRRRYRA